MARTFFGSAQQTPAAVDSDEAFTAEDSPAHRSATRGRLARGGIAVAAAALVGGIAIGVPGLAHGAGLSTSSSPLPASAVEPVRAGTTDAFSVRGSLADRNSTREAINDVQAAAAARASELASLDAQFTAAQTEAAALARTQALSSTAEAIDAESERLAAIKFFWPTEGSIASPWGPRLHPILHYTRLHGGTDIGGALGNPIFAVADGVVTRAATGHNSGSGNNVRIDHGKIDGEALETGYLHMNTIEVAEGTKVKKGQRIGTVGNTGLSTAPHLHLALYVNGVNSDPAPYLNQGR